MSVDSEKSLILVEKMHLACRKVRLAIARLEAEVPPGEESIICLDDAMKLLTEVRETMAC